MMVNGSFALIVASGTGGVSGGVEKRNTDGVHAERIYQQSNSF
jgi:hypothetical protein